jgi:hypothetical protein
MGRSFRAGPTEVDGCHRDATARGHLREAKTGIDHQPCGKAFSSSLPALPVQAGRQKRAMARSERRISVSMPNTPQAILDLRELGRLQSAAIAVDRREVVAAAVGTGETV